jgi:glycosyltransferase involved in cell wall biosynthesis
MSDSSVSRSATPQALSWALVIATYNRADVLARCVRCALRQTRRPAEVIIVDSSDDWSRSRDAVLALMEREAPGIRAIYQLAQVRGQTSQRRQALQLATADILFMLDDDSLMFRRCAERLLDIYDADSSRSVVGVMASPAVAAPDLSPDGLQDIGCRASSTGFWRRLKCWVNSFLVKSFCGPFSPARPSPVPRVLSARWPKLASVTLLDGYRLTVRRDVAERESFDAEITVNAHEDQEASLRLMRHGVLLWIDEPLIFHAEAPRPKALGRHGMMYAAFWQLNHAYINLKLFGLTRDTARRIRRMNRGASLIYFVHGLLRLDFDRLRGARMAQRAISELLRVKEPAELPRVFGRESAALKAAITARQSS